MAAPRHLFVFPCPRRNRDRQVSPGLLEFTGAASTWQSRPSAACTAASPGPHSLEASCGRKGLAWTATMDRAESPLSENHRL